MRRRYFATLSLIFCFHVLAEPSSSEDLFQKGLAAYQNKQFDEARDNFNKVNEEGRASAALFHNLALTYFQLDQKAYAMAFWRKALALDPGFRPAKAGRQFLETRFNMAPMEKDTFSLWIRRTMEAMAVLEITWLIALLMAGGGWMWIRYLAARKIAIEDETPKPEFPVIAAGLTVIFIGALLLVGLKFQYMSAERATVVLPEVSARSLPSDEGVGLYVMAGGTEVLVRQRNGDWLQVQNSDGASGWVKKGEIIVTDERNTL